MKKRVAFACSVLAAAALGGAAPALAQTAPMDIAGIRIGMTEAEVVKALKAFDAGAQVKRNMASYPYFDGVNSLQTPEFLDSVGTSVAGSMFTVHFSGPPAEPRVLAVTRRSSNDNPPTGEQFASALIAKHGPAGVRSLPRTGADIVQWNEAGKPTCTVLKHGSGQLVPDPGVGSLFPPTAVKVLEQQARQRHPGLALSMGASVDAARCGTVLRYQWSGEPVRNFEAWLVDQGGMVAAARRSTQWVKGLEAEAVRKRQAQAGTPKL